MLWESPVSHRKAIGGLTDAHKCTRNSQGHPEKHMETLACIERPKDAHGSHQEAFGGSGAAQKVIPRGEK